MVLSVAPQLLSGAPEVVPGTTLQITTATTPELKSVKTAIAAPALVKMGRPAFTLKTPPPGVAGDWSQRSNMSGTACGRGWSRLMSYLVIVDGRQPACPSA